MKAFITNCGIVSPLGWGGREFWAGLGEKGGPGKDGAQARPLSQFSPASVLGPSGLRRMGRANAILLAAAALVLAEREQKLGGVRGEDIGVVTVAGATGSEDFLAFQRLAMSGGEIDHARLLTSYRNLFANAAAANISIRFGLKGHGCSLSGGTFAGVEGFAHAVRLLTQRRVRAVVVAAIELLTPMLSVVLEHRNGRAGDRAGEEEMAQPGEAAVAILLQAEEEPGCRPPGTLCEISGWSRRTFSARQGQGEAIEEACRAALFSTSPAPRDLILSRGGGDDPGVGEGAEGAAPGTALRLGELFGDCYSAAFPLAVACAALAIATGTVPQQAIREAAGSEALRPGPSCRPAGEPARGALVNARGREAMVSVTLEGADG